MSEQLSTATRPDRRPKRPAAQRARLRRPDDGAAEIVHVIEFLWAVGDAIQPVLLVERKLLN